MTTFSGPKIFAFAAALMLAIPAVAQEPPVTPPTSQAAPEASPSEAPASATPVPAVPEPTAPAATTTAPAVGTTGPGPRIINQTPAAEPLAPATGTPSIAPGEPATAERPANSGDAAPATPVSSDATSTPVDLDETAPFSEAAAPVAPAATLPHDLTPYGMFMAADYIVKSVMIGLAFASLVTWTIWLAKGIELTTARTRAQRAVRRLERADSLQEVVAGGKGTKWPKRGPVAALVHAALREEERSGDLTVEGIKERTQIALHRIEARAGRSMQRGTGLLATIGSTAPFVGLFGTVWGIMNAFIGISKANTTNLAVVAPGIAEALLATAIGLVAAIPAVIIYNVFARAIAGYRAVLADASAEVLRHLSRDLDRREQGVARPAAAAAPARGRQLAAE